MSRDAASGEDTMEFNGGQRTSDDELGSTWEKYRYHILSAIALTIVTIGTVAFHFLEDWSWVDSLYFSTVAVTTVGFGDLAPSTDTSKLFTIAYIVAGITVFGAFLNERLKRRQDKTRHRGDKRASRREE